MVGWEIDIPSNKQAMSGGAFFVPSSPQGPSSAFFIFTPSRPFCCSLSSSYTNWNFIIHNDKLLSMRTLVQDIVKKVGEDVELMGWVAARRDHGKIIFIDLRDRSGIAQIVFVPKPKELYDLANRLRSEWVVRVIGQVNVRPANMENPDLPTGKYEILAKELEILSEAQTPPIAIDTPGYEIGEESRMKYRYLDL